MFWPATCVAGPTPCSSSPTAWAAELGGSVASCLATEVVPATVRNHLAGLPEEVTNDGLVNSLVAGLTSANDAVWKRGKHEPELRGMGTTCVALLARGDRAVIGNAGDSRVYLLRNETFIPVTHDHVLIYEFQAERNLDERRTGEPLSPDHHPRDRFAAAFEPDITLLRMREGDRLLLCSDGLTNMVEDDEIARLLLSESDPQEACELLAQAANRTGGEDNMSVALLQYGEFIPSQPAEPKRPPGGRATRTTACAPLQFRPPQAVDRGRGSRDACRRADLLPPLFPQPLMTIDAHASAEYTAGCLSRLGQDRTRPNHRLS